MHRAARCPARPHYNNFLPTPLQLALIDVVLVRPRNPLNIGAAARAMANFGVTHLTVVDPWEPHWRDARSAVDAEQLLETARLTATVGEAVAGCTLVLGTGSLTYRKPEQPVVQLPDLAPAVRQELAQGGRIAVIFGPENHGLTREDLVWCHRLIEIPTSDVQPSMNLGQAVAVCLYELATRALSVGMEAADGPFEAPAALVDAPSGPVSADLDLLAGLIEEVMVASHYSPGRVLAVSRHDLRLSLRRLCFTRRDLRRALGLFRRILYRLKP